MKELATLEPAYQLLAEAKTLDQVKEIRDKAETMLAYVKKRGLELDAQNYCAELKIRSERKLGQILTISLRGPGNPKLSHERIIGLEELGISLNQSSHWQRIAKLPDDSFETFLQETKAKREELTTAETLRFCRRFHGGRIVNTSESMEWYTPKIYLDAARLVLGRIDLDPASSDIANKTVRAKDFYSASDDGLAHEWHGRIWLNPPWGTDGPKFVLKFLEEYAAKRMAAGILLVNAHSTDADWFQGLWNHLLCFTDHRIDFYRQRRKISSSTHGSVFVYVGPSPRKFAKEFARFGAIVKRWP